MVQHDEYIVPHNDLVLGEILLLLRLPPFHYTIKIKIYSCIQYGFCSWLRFNVVLGEIIFFYSYTNTVSSLGFVSGIWILNDGGVILGIQLISRSFSSIRLDKPNIDLTKTT